MRIVEWIGIGVAVLACALALLFARREFIARRGGTIEVSFRLSTLVPGRGWSPGIARFTGDEMRWYRVFSFGLRPRRVLVRHGLVVEDRRAPEGQERLAMPAGWVVVRCRGRFSGRSEPVEIALAETAYHGFQSWLESAPPGALRR